MIEPVSKPVPFVIPALSGNLPKFHIKHAKTRGLLSILVWLKVLRSVRC